MNNNFTSPDNSRIKSVILNVGISFIIFAIFIAIMETVLRTTHLFGAKTPWIKPDPVLGYRYVPGKKYWHFHENNHPIAGRINSYGWRDKEWSLEKPQNTYRIAVLGDSMVASWDVESDRTFLTITENQLNATSQSKIFELMNFGFSNISQAEELLILKNDVVQFSPDMVLLFFFPGNDISDMNRVTASHIKRPFYDISTNGELLLDTSFSKTSHYKIKRLINLFKQHSALINLIGERYYGYKEQRRIKAQDIVNAQSKKSMPKFLTLCTSNQDARYVKNYQLNKRLIKAMAEYCNKNEIRFMLVTVDVKNTYTPDDEKIYKDMDPTFNTDYFEDDLGEFARSLNIDHLGLQRIFRENYEKNGVSLHWGHWNYEGHKVVANALAEKLKPILASKGEER